MVTQKPASCDPKADPNVTQKQTPCDPKADPNGDPKALCIENRTNGGFGFTTQRGFWVTFWAAFGSQERGPLGRIWGGFWVTMGRLGDQNFGRLLDQLLGQLVVC